MEQINTKKLDDKNLVMNHPFKIWVNERSESAKYSVKNYRSWVYRLFPILSWMPRYNSKWFIGDLIAGTTVGIMVVPQGLAYAALAQLPPQYGLYTAFIGPIIYSVLGSSKDISLGPTAVLSLLTGQAVSTFAYLNYSPQTIAIALALLAGIINLVMLVFRLSILIEFISVPVIIGFTSGSAISIMASQFPSLLGIKGINTNTSALQVIIHTFQKIKKINFIDFGFGVATIAFIISIKLISSRLAKRNRNYAYIGTLKNAVSIVVFTVISYLVYKSNPGFKLTIVGVVKKGLYKPAVPVMNSELFGKLLVKAITMTLVVVLEHIAIAKALARLDHYEIDNESELLSQAVVNIFGSFFGSYASTGSFSRSSVNRNSGSQSPLNGLWTTLVVAISLLFMSKSFYYIPKATITGIIMTSVYDLVSSPKITVSLWKIDPIDFVATITAFLVTILVSVEVGIYSAMGVSVVALLVRIALPRITHLAKERCTNAYHDISVFPLDMPSSGIVVLRPEASLIFINSSFMKKKMSDIVNIFTISPINVTLEKDKFFIENSNEFELARKLYLDQISQSRSQYNIYDDKLQTVGSSLKVENTLINDELPVFKGLVLDMSSVSSLDVTGIQALKDLEVELDDLQQKQQIYYEMIRNNYSELTYVRETKNSNRFMIHYVNVKPNVLRVMEISGITRPISDYRSLHASPSQLSIDKTRTDSKASSSKNIDEDLQNINIANKMLFYISSATSQACPASEYHLSSENVHPTITDAVNSILLLNV